MSTTQNIRSYRDIMQANDDRAAERENEWITGVDAEFDADRAAYYDLDR